MVERGRTGEIATGREKHPGSRLLSSSFQLLYSLGRIQQEAGDEGAWMTQALGVNPSGQRRGPRMQEEGQRWSLISCTPEVARWEGFLCSGELAGGLLRLSTDWMGLTYIWEGELPASLHGVTET